MEKLEKLFKESFRDCKGLVVFYLIVALLAFMISQKMNAINSQEAHNEEKIKQTYYA